MKNGTAKVLCNCVHHDQDKFHGVNKRVANTTEKQDKDFAEVRCTVCSRIHRVPLSEVK